MLEYTVRPYAPADETVWDRFVMEESANGTFLQTRRFLNYHPAGRFDDASLVIENDKGAMVAAVPAAVQMRDGRRVFVSHPGSTYGGPVVRSSYCTAERLLPLCGALDAYLAGQYDRAELKLTPELFCTVPGDLLEYALYHYDFAQYIELNSFVPTAGKTEAELFAQLDRNKKRNVKKCLAHGTEFVPLHSDEEIARFHELLAINLAKYGLKPIHTVPELLDFKNSRLCDEVRFYGVRAGGTMVAAGMLFYFRQANVLHAQNLSADLAITDYSPVSYLYYNVILEAARLGCKCLSWGISTEAHGQKLNMGLIENKEGYGSKFDLNRTCYKDYAGSACLRPLRAEDAPLMLEWMHDEDLVRDMAADFAHKTLADCQAFITAAQRPADCEHRAIADENGTYLGTVSLKNIDRERQQAEFAIAVRRCALGSGYACEGMRQMLEYGFDTLGLRRIYWCVARPNLRAQRFYDKNGYHRADACPEALARPDLFWYETNTAGGPQH